MPTLSDAGGQTQAWVTVGPKSRLPSRAPPSRLQSLSAGAGAGLGNSRRWCILIVVSYLLGEELCFHWLPYLIPILQEPVGPPTPKRPRGRPKGSKNKGPKTALKVKTSSKTFTFLLQSCKFWRFHRFKMPQEGFHDLIWIEVLCLCVFWPWFCITPW